MFLTSLCDYITATVVYIFVFQSWTEEGNNEYMVFYDLKETNMMEFLVSLEAGTVDSIYYAIRDYDPKEYMAELSESTENDRFNGVCSSLTELRIRTGRNCSYFQDLIRSNMDTHRKFKVVEMPFAKSLFEKIIITKKNESLSFGLEEMLCIFQKVFLCLDRNEAVAYNMCMSLQHNPQMISNLFDPNMDLGITESYYSKKLHANEYNFNGVLVKFCEILKQNVEFYLMKDAVQIARAFSKTKKVFVMENRIQLNDLQIGFIFGCLEVSSSYLREYVDIFYEKFKSDHLGNDLTIFVSDTLPLDSILSVIHDNSTVMTELKWISELDLWRLDRLKCITCCVHTAEVYEEFDAENVEFPLISTVFPSFSVNFNESIAKPIEDITLCLKNILDKSVNDLINKISSIKLENIVFENDFVFTREFERVHIYQCEVKKECKVVFKNIYKQLTIRHTSGIFNLSGMAGFSTVEFVDRAANLEFRMNDPELPSKVRLENAQIEDNIVIDSSIDQIFLSDVEIFNTITINFNNKQQTINICETLGCINLTGLFNIKLFAAHRICLLIVPCKHGDCTLLLTTCNIIELGVLEDVFDQIRLKDVEIEEGCCFTVNASCKKLEILECGGIFDLSGPKRFTRIEIDFSSDLENTLTLRGPIKTKTLVLYNMKNSAREITNFFNEFKEIKHIMFKQTLSKYKFVLEDYSADTYQMSRLQETEVYEAPIIPSDQIQKPIIQRDKELNSANNSFLSAIFCAQAMKKIERLEYYNILMSTLNCQYLKNLQNLQALRVRLEAVTVDSLSCLPLSLKFLNITNSLASSINQDPRLVICALKVHSNLRALAIDSDLFNDPSLLLLLPNCIRVLVISYNEFKAKKIGENVTKLKLQRLYVSSYSDMIDDETYTLNEKLTNFLGTIFEYVNRHCLESLVFSSDDKQYGIDPFTLRVMEKVSQKFDVSVDVC
ncbi:putative LRR containing protein [Trachipleistophora hominis]|uniref:Putative LRR containing protein n=1 Tax=Trachipleistophora hominis TaxID=72359 RepID=L7JSC3_TRAHO|nr:putative LRR containing protein [Trachipleistophora hominis]